jgi:hypothetical protein
MGWEEIVGMKEKEKRRGLFDGRFANGELKRSDGLMATFLSFFSFSRSQNGCRPLMAHIYGARASS